MTAILGRATDDENMKSSFLLAPVAIVLGSLGCNHSPPPPPAAPTTTTTTVQTTTVTTTLRPASAGKSNSSLYLSDELRKLCAITSIESTKQAPKFAFDESDVSAEDRDVLAAVATCLTQGPLKGRSVKLVGRTDARGATDYNMALGARRADAVQKYLANLGVPAGQMTETSRGELDATGKGEEGYKKDRRGDIDVM